MPFFEPYFEPPFSNTSCHTLSHTLSHTLIHTLSYTFGNPVLSVWCRTQGSAAGVGFVGLCLTRKLRGIVNLCTKYLWHMMACRVFWWLWNIEAILLWHIRYIPLKGKFTNIVGKLRQYYSNNQWPNRNILLLFIYIVQIFLHIFQSLQKNQHKNIIQKLIFLSCWEILAQYCYNLLKKSRNKIT